VLLALISIGACSHDGGQTGEESEGRCAAELSVVELDAVSPLGFSARDTLALSEGEHRAAFDWVPSNSYPYGPESGASEIRVTLTHSGSARFARVTAEQQSPYCRDHLELPVVVTLSTSRGAFAERFSATLQASQGERATLSHALLGETVAGGFALQSNEPFSRVDLTLEFSRSGFSGSLQALMERSSGDSVSALALPLACWGSPSDDLWWCSR